MTEKSPSIKRKILGFYVPGHPTQLMSVLVSFGYVTISVLAIDSAVYAYLMNFTWETDSITPDQFNAFAKGFMEILFVYSGGIIFVFGLITSYISLHLSHHFAGPSVQIQKAIQSMIDGDYSKKIVLRENDELKSLADSLNQLAEKLSSQKK